MKIAKVATTSVLLWAVIWTPYAVVTFMACFGNRSLVTPLVSQLPAFFAKTASCLNPVIYALSHPKYREAMSENCAFLGFGNSRNANEDKDTKMQTLRSEGA